MITRTRRQALTDPSHVQTAARIRADYDRTRSGAAVHRRSDGDLVRDLTDYDTRFGIDFDTEAGASFDAGQVAV